MHLSFASVVSFSCPVLTSVPCRSLALSVPRCVALFDWSHCWRRWLRSWEGQQHTTRTTARDESRTKRRLTRRRFCWATDSCSAERITHAIPLQHPAHASPSHPAATLPIVLDLGSSSISWTVTNANKSVSVPATVPGNVYLDLVASGVLGGDPLYRDNERFFQWVASDAWTWRAQFDVSDAMLACPTITLEALGIDTVATITLNGQQLGTTDNMHRRYTFALAGLLKSTANVIEIAIESPLQAALQRMHAYPYQVPRTMQIGSFDNGNFLRKAASDFGWSGQEQRASAFVWLLSWN